MARNDKTDAGMFNRPIQIQALSRTDDGQGGAPEVWTTVYSCFAHLDFFPFQRGLNRQYMAMQLYPTAQALITMRYQTSVAITPAMSVLHNGHRYRILGAKVPHMEQVTTILFCSEWEAKGTP